MSGLVHLIYSSAATRPMPSDELMTLLEFARKKNESLDVTGMLLFVDGSFFQVLEGDGEVVDELFAHIERDERHEGVVTIIREPISKRAFGDWSMGYAAVTSEELASAEGLNDFFVGEQCFDSLGPGRTKKLLKAFKSGRWRSRLQQDEKSAPTSMVTDMSAPDAEIAQRPPVSYAFQPIIDIAEQSVVSHEAIEFDHTGEAPALARSDDPLTLTRVQMESHLMAIGMATRLGLSTGITLNFAVHRCENAARMMQSTIDGAESFGLLPDRLTLELDHDQLLEDPQWFASVLLDQRAVGMRISIDHFGAGRSGHYLIDTYQPDGVALTEGLVRHIETNGARQAIVRGILQMAEDLGIDVVAKHIKSQSELDWFQSEGVDIFQGPFFAKPTFEQLATDVFIPSRELA